MPTNETPDSGATAFVMPQTPQDAVLRLTIKVEAGEGDSLQLSAVVTPGGEIFEHEKIASLFRQAVVVPQLGTYQFETSANLFRFLSFPEGLMREEVRDLARFLVPAMSQRRDQLVAALEAFPTAEVIAQAARQIVSEILGGSLERSPLEIKPVVDARTATVQGVDCINCGFGIGGILGLALSAIFGEEAAIDDGITEVGNIKFAIRNRDGSPVVQVGYLSHSSDFSTFLNNVLADRVRASVQVVTEEIATEMLVRAETARRQFERMNGSIQATYQVDPMAITARVDAIEAETRARLAPPPEADGDGTDETDDQNGDGDTGDGTDDDEADEETPAAEPAPESAAPAEEPAPTV